VAWSPVTRSRMSSPRAYGDGTILSVRLHDGAEILGAQECHPRLSRPLAWNANGTRLAFAAEDGEAGLLASVAAISDVREQCFPPFVVLVMFGGERDVSGRQ